MPTIELKSPVKGVNRLFSRSEQPEGSCWDALNVLPFDRSGRLRVGQRPGTSKLYASAIGDGLPVDMLAQVTRPADPVTLIDEPFTYADGALQTVAPQWAGGTQSGSFITMAYPANNGNGGLTVSSNQLYSASTQAIARIYRHETIVPSAWSFFLQVTYVGSSTTSGSPLPGVVLPFWYGGTNKSAFARFEGSAVQIYVDGTLRASGSATISAGKVCSLVVNGDTLTAKVNGVTVCSGTVSGVSANSLTGVGVGVIQTTSGNATITADDFKCIRGTAGSDRTSYIIATAGGTIYVGNTSSTAAATNGEGALAFGTIPSMAAAQGTCYFVDGDAIKVLTLSTSTVADYSATAGVAPTGCTLTCLYRDRLVLAAPADNPQNMFFSRVGTHTDWDYTDTDSGAAFAGNAATSGRIGEPIIALMPFGDDIMLVGGDHNIWIMHGDPGHGGSFDILSNQIGILGRNAWCEDATGTIYFVGTGGLFRMGKESEKPELVSVDKYNQFFSSINRGTNYVTMTWDRDNHGAHIFITPKTSGTATHLWYDARTDTVWPIQFPNSHGPISALVYDGDAPTDRVLLLGGRTGYIQKMDSASLTDDSTAITAYVVLGPVKPAEGEAIINGMTLDMGELASADSGTPATFNCLVKIRGGNTAYSVTEGTPQHLASVTLTRDRRSKTIRQRVRGAWFTVELRNVTASKYFSFERAEVEFVEAGRNRRPR